MIQISKRIILKGIRQFISNPVLGITIIEKIFYDKLRINSIRNKKMVIGPENANVSITNFCNYQCIFCSCHSNLFRKKHSFDRKEIFKNKSMDFEIFKGLLKSLNKLGTRLVNIAGMGEPFLHPNLIGMIRYAREKKILTAISTNGSLLNPKLINKLVDAGLNGISISLNAGTNETYIKLHPTAKPGTFEKIKENIKLLSKSNIVVRISFVMNKYNCNEFNEMVNRIINLNVDVVDFSPFKGYRDTSNLEIEKERQIKLNNKISKLKGLLDKKGIIHNLPLYLKFYNLNTKPILTKIMCFGPYSFTHIREDGSVYLCCLCSKKLGNINEKPFDKIWFSKKYNLFREKVSNGKNMKEIGKLDDDCDCWNCNLIRDVISEYKKVLRIK